MTDSATTPASITNTYTLVINPVQDLTTAGGAYAFTFSGFNPGGYVAAAGSFTANGLGGISTGEADFTTLQSNTLFTGITGTYTAGVDGRGTITFNNVTGMPTFAFSIDPGGSGHGRLIEFDGTGTRGSGRLEAQTESTCVVGSTTTYIGNFAFGGTGFTSSVGPSGAGPLAFAGAITATPPIAPTTVGSLGPGEMDENVPGSVPLGSAGGDPISGSYLSGPDNSHCIFQMSASLGNLNYDVYPVSAIEAFLIETDTATNPTSPYVSIADMKLQIGQPFFGTVINSPMVGGVSGTVLNVPYVSVLQLVPGGANFDLSLTDNTGGIVTSTAGTPQSVTYSSDQYGRVFTGLVVNNAFEPVLYMIDSQDAFVMGQLGGAPIFGAFDSQSRPAQFTTQFILQNSSLVEGTTAPAVSGDRDFSGYLIFDGGVTPATVNGTQDESTSSANTSGETVTGIYVLSPTGATDGSGTVTLTSPAAFTGAYYLVSPTKMVMMTTTPGDTNPVLVIVGR